MPDAAPQHRPHTAALKHRPREGKATAPAHWFTTRQGRAFRDAILRRDLFICQMCGVIVKGGRSHHRSAVVDHVRPVSLAPHLERDPDNCRTVCRRCHATCDSIEKRHAPDIEAIAKAKMQHRLTGVDGWPAARP